MILSELGTDLLTILPWVLPVIVGAVIGYVTNAIAIRMLFRPLREKRVFGIRVPFTPGIIPRQRYKFSASIGRMVSDELITGDTLKKQMSKESFRRGIYSTISRITESFFLNPVEFFGKERVTAIGNTGERVLSEILRTIFNSKFFIYSVRKVVNGIIDSSLEVRVIDFLGKFVNRGNMSTVSSRIIKEVLANDYIRENLIDWLVRIFFSKERKSGEEVLKSEIIFELFEFLGDLVRNILPSIYVVLFQWLRGDEMHKILEINGKFLLRDLLDKLNIVQKFLISAGQFDRSLEEKMPEIVDEVLDYVENLLYRSEVVDRIGNLVTDGLERWYTEKNKTSKGKILGYTEEEFKELVAKLYDGFLVRLKTMRIEGELDRFGERLLNSYGELTLGEIIVRKLGMSNSEIVEGVSNLILDIFSNSNTAVSISGKIVEYLLYLRNEGNKINLMEYFGITEEQKRRLDDFIFRELMKLLENRVVDLVKSIDINNLVVEKIDGLDIESVEGLLLKLIAEHLRWINIFGAILGGIIGLTQVALRFVG